MSGIIESNAGRSSGVVAAAGSITKSTSEPAADTNPSGGVGTLWLRTSTGEMYCCTDASTDDNVWTNIGEGTGQQPPISAATGGTVTTDGDYKVHTFNSSSNFVVTTSDADVEYLVIAGEARDALAMAAVDRERAEARADTGRQGAFQFPIKLIQLL